MASMRIGEIHVVDRHRRDLGNLDSLRESIATHGLLHPVVVTAGGRLVAGERRLAACSQLGWEEVDVRIVNSLDSAAALLAAERDENTCRLDMTPSEKVALGRALEELERPAARERQRRHGGTAPGRAANTSEKFSEVKRDQSGETMTVVGQAVGMSRPTYNRAKTVVAQAEKGDPVAVQARDEMDRTGKVSPAYEKVVNGDAETITKRDEMRGNAHKERIVKLASSLAGFAAGIESLDVDRARAVMEPAELEEWARSLGDSLRKLNRLRVDLQRGRS